MFPEFLTPRLVFRAVEDYDVQSVMDLYRDPGTAAGAMLQLKPLSLSDAKAIVAEASKHLFSVMICLPANGTANKAGIVVGRMSLGPMDDQHSYFDIVISKEYEGLGYGYEALSYLLEWAFTSGGLRRVEGNVFSWNAAARSLYSKLGFVQEGVKREHHFYDGKWQDTVQVAMLISDWKATRIAAS